MPEELEEAPTLRLEDLRNADLKEKDLTKVKGLLPKRSATRVAACPGVHRSRPRQNHGSAKPATRLFQQLRLQAVLHVAILGRAALGQYAGASPKRTPGHLDTAGLRLDAALSHHRRCSCSPAGRRPDSGRRSCRRGFARRPRFWAASRRSRRGPQGEILSAALVGCVGVRRTPRRQVDLGPRDMEEARGPVRRLA
jgi:hypothetical protein